MRKTTSCLITGAFALAIVVACVKKQIKPEHTHRYQSVDDTLYLPLDTSRILAMLELTETLIPRRPVMDSLDTLELEYKAYACDCPDWVVSEVAELPSADTAVMHGSYYIESGSTRLSDHFFVAGNRIRFFGKLRSTNDLPRHKRFQGPHPPPGKVFTYYGFEVLRPTRVRGPFYHTGDSVDTESEMKKEVILSSTLTLP